MKYIGAHITKDNSILKTIQNIHNNDGNSIQIFVSSPMNSSFPNKEKINEESKKVIEFCDTNNFKLIVHASYVINLANSHINKRVIDIKDRWWIKLLIAELDACELLNGIGVVVHVGKYTKLTPEEGLENMYQSIKYIISYLIDNNYKSKLIIENPAGVGTELLKTPLDFCKFYNKFTNKEKKNLGICIDTAHIWSSGFDIIEYYKNFSELNNVIVIHLNNSKVTKGALLDRHEYLFDGKININDLKNFVSKMKESIIILEKPTNKYITEFEWIKNIN